MPLLYLAMQFVSLKSSLFLGVKMTMRGRFFTSYEYQQLVYGALVDMRGKIKTLPPAILKPKMLWSGKQIVATIIINVVPEGKDAPTLHSKAKIKGHEWEKTMPRPWKAGGKPLALKPENGPTMCESEVIFSKGEFLSGILDKNQYGATQYSLVHAFFELYGGTYSGQLLSAFSKIFTLFLHTEGFTLGVRDILVRESANKKRKDIMERTKKVGFESASDGVGLLIEDQLPDEEDLDIALENAHRESRKVNYCLFFFRFSQFIFFLVHYFRFLKDVQISTENTKKGFQKQLMKSIKLVCPKALWPYFLTTISN